MNIDFFVHPEHARLDGFPVGKRYERYMKHLQKIYEDSDFPVVVTGHKKSDFENQFPLEHTLESASYFIYEGSIDKGEIDPTDWEKFVAIVDQGTHYRVHGSFFGECTLGFSIQLFGHLQRGEHWNNWRALIPREQQLKEKKQIRYHEFNGDFLNCNIKYGVVLSPKKPKKMIKTPPLIKSISKRPHGNIVYQLMDDNTVTYNVKKLN